MHSTTTLWHRLWTTFGDYFKKDTFPFFLPLSSPFLGVVFLTLRASLLQRSPCLSCCQPKTAWLFPFSPLLQLACLEDFLLKSNNVLLELLFESFLFFLLMRLRSCKSTPTSPVIYGKPQQGRAVRVPCVWGAGNAQPLASHGPLVKTWWLGYRRAMFLLLFLLFFFICN